MIGATTGAATPAATNPTATDPREAALRQAAEAFEAVFLRQLIGSMRQAKLADNMAQQGSFGIADLLLQQMRAVIRRVDNVVGGGETPASPAHTNNVGGTA